jgi:hypothetical protein
MVKDSAQARRAKSRTSSEPFTFGAHPQTFRLPRAGANDPYFGITRGGYYRGEVEGWWTLIRLKRAGMKRGTTLIDYNQVASFIAKQRSK